MSWKFYLFHYNLIETCLFFFTIDYSDDDDQDKNEEHNLFSLSGIPEENQKDSNSPDDFDSDAKVADILDEIVLKNNLDIHVTQLNEHENLMQIKHVVKCLLEQHERLRKYTLFGHPIFAKLRLCLVTLLHRNQEILSQNSLEEDALVGIELLFSQLCKNINRENVNDLAALLFDVSLITAIELHLKSITCNWFTSDAKLVIHMVDAFYHLQKHRVRVVSRSKQIRFIDVITSVLSLPQSRNHIEMLINGPFLPFFEVCLRYIYVLPTTFRHQALSTVFKMLRTPFIEWLESLRTTETEWNSKTSRFVESISEIFETCILQYNEKFEDAEYITIIKSYGHILTHNLLVHEQPSVSNYVSTIIQQLAWLVIIANETKCEVFNPLLSSLLKFLNFASDQVQEYVYTILMTICPIDNEIQQFINEKKMIAVILKAFNVSVYTNGSDLRSQIALNYLKRKTSFSFKSYRNK